MRRFPCYLSLVSIRSGTVHCVAVRILSSVPRIAARRTHENGYSSGEALL